MNKEQKANKEDTDKKIIIVRKKKYLIDDSRPKFEATWKIAYADFITALMALFLILWLINVVEKDSLHSIAHYFSKHESKLPKTSYDGGNDPANESGLLSKYLVSNSILYGANSKGLEIKLYDKTVKLNLKERQYFLSLAKDFILDDKLQKYSENLVMVLTDDGLNIEVKDLEYQPVFKKNTSNIHMHSEEIIRVIADLVENIPNYIAVTGHVFSSYDKKDNVKNIIEERNDKNHNKKNTGENSENDQKLSNQNWKLSIERALSIKNIIEQNLSQKQTGDVTLNKIIKVVGRGDSCPINPFDKKDSANNRITITILKPTSVESYNKSMPPKIVN